MMLLLPKLVLVPTLIALITLAGRRWGPHVAGWLSAFPVVGGPILLFIALERGVDFASVSALGMFTAITANIFFSISYAWLATRCHWFFTLVLALLIYALLVFVLERLSLLLWQAVLANLCMIVLAPRLFPSVTAPDRVMQHSAIELPLRMLAGAVLVLLVTYFSAQLGSRLSGMMAMFPLMASVLAVFSHRNVGKEFAIQLLRGALLGWYAFAVFSLLLALFLASAGIAGGFAIALGAALLVQTLSLHFVKKLQDELELLE